MRAFTLSALGAAPALTAGARPLPGPDEVQIAVAAAGLNFADLLMIKGTYQHRPTPPFTLGLEAAGTVTALGSNVTGFAPGDRVAAFHGSGALAEYATFPASATLQIPDDMPWDIAAGFQVAYGTSHLALADIARLTADDTLLVLGAAGGVGLTAVELGAALGARVIGVARGTDRLGIAARAGAHHVLDSATPDLARAIKSITRPTVIYDAVGGDLFDAAFRAAAPYARILIIGFASGRVPEAPLNIAMVKNLQLLGVNWGAYVDDDPARITASLTELTKLYTSGHLKPHISHRLPLDRAAEALDLLKTRQATGKIVVTVSR